MKTGTLLYLLERLLNVINAWQAESREHPPPRPRAQWKNTRAVLWGGCLLECVTSVCSSVKEGVDAQGTAEDTNRQQGSGKAQ